MNLPTISRTAQVHGFGSDRYKWVSGLTEYERNLVKMGEMVIVDSGRKSGGSYGTTWRVVTFVGGRWNRRVPGAIEMKLIEQFISNEQPM